VSGAILIIVGVYVAMSVVSFFAYGIDKWKARSGRRRIRERTLLTFDALGGWPGGLVAQRVFRHKTRDPSFRGPFTRIVVIHAIGWMVALGWHATEGGFLGLRFR